MTAKASNKLKIARGTNRPSRAKSDPSANPGRPVKPEWLREIASAKWDEVIALLEAENQLAPIYGDFVAMYCQAFQDFHDAQTTIDDEGKYCHSEKGGIYQHPAVGVQNKAIERINKFGRQLGLSGASIKHVQKTEKQDVPSAKKRFFGKQA